MKNPIYNCNRLVLIILAVAFAGATYSQISRSAYFFEQLPIANSLNPAFTAPGEAYLSLPLISSTYVSVNLPLNYSQIIRKSDVNDNLYINSEAILDELDDVNLLSVNLYSLIGQFGLRFDKHIFQVGLAKVATTNLFIEKDLVEFLLKGNAHPDMIGRNISLNETGLNFSLYHEISLCYSLEYNPKISLGVKFKYLNGQANIYTEKNNINIHTSDQIDYSITASSDIAVHTSSTYGQFKDLGDQDLMNYAWIDFSNNHGFAFDLGAVYKPLPFLCVSLSVIDLGKINWKENTVSYVSENPGEEFTFQGIDINDFIVDNTFTDTIPMLDSITDHFRISETSGSYTSYVTPKTYLGIAYDLTKNDQFGFLFKTDFYKYCTRSIYTINYKRKLGSAFSALINYSFGHNKSSLGLGMAAKVGPVNIYAISDSMQSYFNTLTAQNVNFQFGITFIFGEH